MMNNPAELQCVVRVMEARNLPLLEYGGVNPYVTLSFRGLSRTKGARLQTSVLQNSPNPIWNQELILFPKRTDEILVAKIYDKDPVGPDRLIGLAEIPLQRYMNRGVTNEWFQLMSKRAQYKGFLGGRPDYYPVQGQLHLQIFAGFGGYSAPSVATIPPRGQVLPVQPVPVSQPILPVTQPLPISQATLPVTQPLPVSQPLPVTQPALNVTTVVTPVSQSSQVLYPPNRVGLGVGGIAEPVRYKSGYLPLSGPMPNVASTAVTPISSINSRPVTSATNAGLPDWYVQEKLQHPY